MSRTLVKKTQSAMLFCAGLFVLMTAADYIAGVNSDAMAYARRAVSESTLLRQEIGNVERVDLKYLWAFRQKSGFGFDRTELSLRVTGANETISIVLKLNGEGDSWSVLSSSVPL